MSTRFPKITLPPDFARFCGSPSYTLFPPPPPPASYALLGKVVDNIFLSLGQDKCEWLEDIEREDSS